MGERKDAKTESEDELWGLAYSKLVPWTVRRHHVNPADAEEMVQDAMRLFVKSGNEEGRLLRSRDCGIVNVAEHAYRSQKWRFVIAHEMGHFLRHPNDDNFEACTRGDLSNYTGTGRESEANDFASELLMPGFLFKKKCDRNRPSLRDIVEIATDFQTSVTATALRFVLFAPEPCAVIHSTDGIVDWLDWSPNFCVGIRRGTRLNDRTYAGDLFAGKHVDDRASQVDGDAWSDSAWAADIELFEHSRKVAPGSVLTFLWHRA